MLNLHGLRAKSALALALACLAALVPAVIGGWRLLEEVRGHFGAAFVENYTRLNRERIRAPVVRDLALSIRLAGSGFARDWLLDETDPDKRARVFREAEGYRRDFRDGSYFLISALDNDYYYNADGQPFSDQPRYRLDPAKPEDAWFFNILRRTTPYNINVNPDRQLGTTRVWLNVSVMDGERRIGLAGTGLDLGGFLAEFIQTRPPGVTPMILDRGGAIQAHPDPARISFGATALEDVPRRTLAALLPDARQRQHLEQAMAEALTTDAADAAGRVPLIPVTLDGRSQILALAWIPELQWFVATAVDLGVASVVQATWLRGGLLAAALMLLILLIGFALAVERVVLRPLRALRHSATTIARGDYAVRLPPAGNDELGDLSRAFERMADRIRGHTAELEARVRERTAQLEQANQDMALAQRQIRDSIDYASLIQRAILPDSHPAGAPDLEQCVLWRPRDVVGGDLHLSHDFGDGHLIGVLDCAGHGVPGALMTMLAHAALNQAIDRLGPRAPAALLTQLDASLRALLGSAEAAGAIAIHMDAGLAFIDRVQGRLRYAGARINLYHDGDGGAVECIPGGRRPLGDRRTGAYDETELPLDRTRTCYLVTDGYLDQAGGARGFGMGRTRFMELLAAQSGRPLAEQVAALDQALETHRGAHARMDDITVVAFRVGPIGPRESKIQPGS